MSVFEEKRISPILMGTSGIPFDSEDHLFELKFDGTRCLAYLDPQEGTQLRNKRNINVNPAYPELMELHTQAKGRCILDGELVVFENGKPAFSEVQRRALMMDPFKIRLAAQRLPACFVAFDIRLVLNICKGQVVLSKKASQVYWVVHEKFCLYSLFRKRCF